MSFVQSDDGSSFFSQATAALIKPARQFGPIVAQITINERTTDRAEKTSHPVELTANVSDHVIPQPVQLMVRMGWTNYGLQSPSSYVNEAITSTPVPIPQSITAIYTAMRGILYGRVPIQIVTGKRMLKSMILLSITEETDERTENSLILSCLCEEIFLVETQLVTMPPNSVQANPMGSASPTSYGTKQVIPAPTTVTPPVNPKAITFAPSP